MVMAYSLQVRVNKKIQSFHPQNTNDKKSLQGDVALYLG